MITPGETSEFLVWLRCSDRIVLQPLKRRTGYAYSNVAVLTTTPGPPADTWAHAQVRAEAHSVRR
jgi:hypothetical protein